MIVYMYPLCLLNFNPRIREEIVLRPFSCQEMSLAIGRWRKRRWRGTKTEMPWMCKLPGQIDTNGLIKRL